jgi:SAM-dependent methyltransferase
VTRRRWWQAPAARALLAQCLAYPLLLATVWLLARAGLPPSWTVVACTQGAWAALLSWRFGLAPWWCAIGCAFPPVVLLASGAGVPPTVFLGAFLFLLLWYWSTFRTQVPYYPSGRQAWDLVVAALPAGPLRVLDIGSGLGGFVLDLARRRPDCTAEGIELAPLPWLASRLRAALVKSRARFWHGDYDELNFGHYDVVFAYLSPAAMDALWRKAHAEMRPGSLLFSYEFVIPDRAPDRRFVTGDGKKTLYLWHF